MNPKLYLLLVLFFGSGILSLSAQDPHFSQFYANPLYQNPAMTGNSWQSRFVAQYRNQWPLLGPGYNTAFASFDTYLPNAKAGGIEALGLGLQLYHDRRGSQFQTTGALFSVSGQYNIDHDFTRVYAGLQGGFISSQFNTGNLTYVSNLLGYSDPLATASLSRMEPDFSGGLLLELGYDNMVDVPLVSFGVSARHFNKRVEEGNWYGREWGVQANAKIPVSLSLWAHGTGKEMGQYKVLDAGFQLRRQGVNMQWNAGANLIYSPLIVGVWYRGFAAPRRNDALIAVLGIHNRNFMVQYSYDITLSSLGLWNTAGAHEITLWYEFESGLMINGKKGSRRKQRLCPVY